MFETPAGRLLGGSVAALEQGVRAWKTQPVDWDLMGEAQLSEDAMGISEDMLAAFEAADIEVSDRYGAYNEGGELLPVEHPWLKTFNAAQ